MPATSKTIVRMWTKDGYHKDVLVIDSDQIRIRDGIVENSNRIIADGTSGAVRAIINPSDFPEAVDFEVIVVEYPKR